MAPDRTARYERALARARQEGIVAFPNTDGTWSCKDYTLTIVGPQAAAVRCNCAAGEHNAICKHLICVAWARKYGVRPIRPDQ